MSSPYLVELALSWAKFCNSYRVEFVPARTPNPSTLPRWEGVSCF